jgi:hypothetical protein
LEKVLELVQKLPGLTDVVAIIETRDMSRLTGIEVGRYSDGEPLWELCFYGVWAVAVAAALAPYVIRKVASVCRLAGIAVRNTVYNFSMSYVGGIFDAEGCIRFQHQTNTANNTVTYLKMHISQASLEFNTHLAAFLKQVCGKSFTANAASVTGQIAASYAFYKKFVMPGYCLRKGYKLFCCIQAWFPLGKGMPWGNLSVTMPPELLDELPNLPNNIKRGSARNAHGYAIQASRYKAYLEHVPVRCESNATGNLAVLQRDGMTSKIPGLWEGRRALFMAARPDLLHLKAAFAQ